MNRIKELRQAYGYTQIALGELLNCSGAAVSRYEQGQRELDLTTLEQLCNVFGCTSDYLLGLSNEPTAQLPRGDELKSELQRMIDELSPEDEALVKAFVAGLKASRK